MRVEGFLPRRSSFFVGGGIVEQRKTRRRSAATDEELSALGSALRQAKARSIFSDSNDLWYVHREPGGKWQIARMYAGQTRYIRPA